MENLPLIEPGLLDGGLPAHSEQRLSKRQKFLYGICETGIQAVKMVEGFYFTVFLLEVANVHPVLVGNIMLIGQVWDAIAHPIVGKLTDHTKSRWGRRRPWILLATIPYAAAYFAMWQVPPIENQTLQFLYYLLMLMLLNTFDTCISVPFTAMTPELASSYDEATELTTFRLFTCTLWGIVATFVHSVLYKSFPSESNPEVLDYQKGYYISAIVIGLSLIPGPVAFSIFIKEKQVPDTVEEVTTESGFRRAWNGILNVLTTFKNKGFVLAMGVYFLCLCSINFIQSNLLLYMTYVLHRDNHFQWFILVVQAVAAVSTVMWAKISNKLGKQRTYYIGIIFLIGSVISLLFLPSGVNLGLLYALGVFAGLGIGIAMLIPWSFLPDVINQDELDTGLKREGVFYSIFVLFQRAGIAVALASSSYILSFAGYVNPKDEPGAKDYQPDSVITALRIMLGAIPAALLGFSNLLVWFYPLTKEKVTEIQIKLTEIRKQNEEEAIFSCRASVFKHSDGNWKQIDGGSSRIWLMKHGVYVAYRVVGCREDNQEFVLNASVVADIVYQKATSKFVQWKDEEAVYGLNFNTDEEADQFVEEFQGAIDVLANLPEETPRGGSDSPLSSPKLPESPRVVQTRHASNPPPPLSNPPPPSYVPPPLGTPLPPPIPSEVAIPPPIDSPTLRKIKRKNSEKVDKKIGTIKDKEGKDKTDSGANSREIKRKNSKNFGDAQKIASSSPDSRDALERRSKRDSADGIKVKDIKDKDKRKDSDEIKRKSTRDSIDSEEKIKRSSKNLDSGVSSVNNSGEIDKRKLQQKKDTSKRKSQNLSDSPANSGDFTQNMFTQPALLKMPALGEGDSLRSKQAKEMLSTEISFVASLDKLYEKWIEPMENKKMISEEDSRTLFANIGSIRIFNRNLLENLQQRMQEWDDTKTIIGDIFVQLGPFLKTYKTYCDNYDKAIAVYERIRAKKSLASFFKGAEAACGGFTLPFFLIMPVQRIPRYMLLLRELVNKTPKEHPDYANLHKALTMVAEIAEIVNKSVREAERVRMLENLIKKNFGGIEALMAPHRQLLLEGDLVSNVKSVKKDCDYVLLFNDLIAFVGENKSQKVIESTIKFDIAWVKDSSEVSPTSFEVLTPEYSIVLTAADVDSKKMWFEEVDKAIKDFLLTTKRNQKDNWLKEDDPETRITKFTFTEGSSYEGEWKGSKMCGKGVYKSKNGSVFDGLFDKGIMFGHGVAKYAGGEEYDGEWRFDVPHGKGKLVTKNGVYDGEWETGRKSGQGTMTWENGDVYVGSWQNDVVHGKGKLTFADGSFYEGEFKEGKRHGTGTFLSCAGSKYEGAWVDDKRNGKGKLTLLGSEVYEGDFTENKKNGDGVWISATGKEKYDGEWRDDARHGKGTLTGTAGYSYVGNWKENKKYGQGKEVLPDGSSYEGTWAANQYEGSGLWIGAEGQKYEGNFHQGKKFGKGVFVDVDGSRYEGDYLHDRKEGKGKVVYKNGCWYQGDWLSDQFHGQGTMVWSDGTKYTGDWQNGMRHGNGKYETALGFFEGEWKNDVRDGNGVFKGKDNAVYEGEWKENRKNGKAKHTDATGNVTQQMWRDGIMKTPGIKYFAPELPDTFKLL